MSEKKQAGFVELLDAGRVYTTLVGEDGSAWHDHPIPENYPLIPYSDLNPILEALGFSPIRSNDRHEVKLFSQSSEVIGVQEISVEETPSGLIMSVLFQDSDAPLEISYRGNYYIQWLRRKWVKVE